MQHLTHQQFYWMFNEVKRQTDELDAIERFYKAYDRCCSWWESFRFGQFQPAYIRDLNEVITGKITPLGQPWRTTPVTFANGNHGVPPDNLERAMRSLVNSTDLEPYEWTHEFLKIHPFEDGNGRCAVLMYNYLQHTLWCPEPLPEFEF